MEMLADWRHMGKIQVPDMFRVKVLLISTQMLKQWLSNNSSKLSLEIADSFHCLIVKCFIHNTRSKWHYFRKGLLLRQEEYSCHSKSLRQQLRKARWIDRFWSLQYQNNIPKQIIYFLVYIFLLQHNVSRNVLFRRKTKNAKDFIA